MTKTTPVVTMPIGGYTISSNIGISSNNIGISTMSPSSWSAADLDLKQNKDILKVTERLAEIEKRLAILAPNEELHVKYPSLKEAYDHYKLIEKLVGVGGI